MSPDSFISVSASVSSRNLGEWGRGGMRHVEMSDLEWGHGEMSDLEWGHGAMSVLELKI